MNNNVSEKKMAVLESKLDILETELDNLNNLLQKCGFRKGIASLKLAVNELMRTRGPDGIL